MHDRHQTKWHALGYDQLLVETWDGQTLLYNPASGHTHVLNQTAAALLAELARQHLSTAQLAAHYLDDSNHLGALLQQLQQLELIGLICQRHN